MYKNKIAFLMACVLLASCGPRAPKTYPAAGRTDVCDVFYGDTVEDPYRWMENDTSAEVASWVREENALTRSYLDAIPFRAALKERLTDLYKVSRSTLSCLRKQAKSGNWKKWNTIIPQICLF